MLYLFLRVPRLILSDHVRYNYIIILIILLYSLYNYILNTVGIYLLENICYNFINI